MVVGDFPLKGKVAVVTGGGSGINLAFVKLALHSGAKVLIADLKLLPEAEDFIKHLDGKVAFTKCDVSVWEDLEKLPSEAEKALGSVPDVWVAGAGIFEPRWSSFLYDNEKDHYKALQINTEHPIKLTRIAMRVALRANKPCVIMIVASMAGVQGQYGAALYCASKHAVVGFTKSMAQADADEDVKVVAICPGMVKTPLWTGEQAKDVAKQYAYNDDMCISPEDVAEAMREMVEGASYGGGSLMEVSKGNLRGRLDSQQAGSLAVQSEEGQKWLENNYRPIRDVFAKERKGAKV